MSARKQSVNAWLPIDLVRRLDAHLAARCAGAPGVRPSRQAFIIDAITRALSDAEHPALAAHRGRLAEAAALDAHTAPAESSAGPGAGPTGSA